MRTSKSTQLLLYAVKRGYRIDDTGTVFSPSEHELVLMLDTAGYRHFTVQNRSLGLKGAISVHRYQAYHLFGDVIFKRGIHVRHLNGNKLDNSKSNIAIGTASQNSFDRPKKQRKALAILAASYRRKLSDSEVMALRHDHNVGMSYSKLVKKYKVSKTCVHLIVNRKTYQNV